MSIRPLGIFSGASRRLIALAALAALLATPSLGHAFTVFLAPLAVETELKCGDGTKYVVALMASHFQGSLSAMCESSISISTGGST